jgi:hypothetical protein
MSELAAIENFSTGEGLPLSWQKKLAFGLTTVVFFLLLFVAIAEGATRWMAPKSDAVKLGVALENSARPYGLRASHRSLQTGVMVQTNSLGFRENEYPVQRQTGTARLVVLGDSFTFGVGVEFAEIYPKRLEAALNRSERRHEVINFGVPGYNTSAELATWREVATRYRPDLVIVGYVLNDTEILSDVQSDATQDETAGSWLTSSHLAMKKYSFFYRFVAPKLGGLAGLFNVRYAMGRTHQIVRSFDEDSPGWQASSQALLEIVREVRDSGATTLVVIFPMMVDFKAYPLTQAHSRITAFCRDHGIEVLDLLSTLQGQEVSRMIVPMDGHPNGIAHRVFADRIEQHLAQNPALLAGRR